MKIINIRYERRHVAHHKGIVNKKKRKGTRGVNDRETKRSSIEESKHMEKVGEEETKAVSIRLSLNRIEKTSQL